MEDPKKNKLKLRLKIGRNKGAVRASVHPPPAPDLDPSLGPGLGLRSQSQALVLREQKMMDSKPSEQNHDQLHTDLERLWVQISIQVKKIFSEDFSPDLLRAAVICILEQEDLDERWLDFPPDRVPVWRPSRTLQNHNLLLQHMVQSRLRPKTQDPQSTDQDHTRLTSSVKQEVLRLGRVLLGDLLFLSRSIVQVYPGHIDILNYFLKLYHNSFRLRLQELADVSSDSDRAYLLLWTNHIYQQEVLFHPELKDQLKISDLGPLLSPLVLKKIQDEHQDSTQGRVQLWLGNILVKEEESWRSGCGSEDIDGFCFSPLALDIIQVIDGAVQDLRCLRPDQSPDKRPDQTQILLELPDFLSRYRCSLEEYLKKDQRNRVSVIKAQLVCEEQLRDFVLSREMDPALRQRCLESLSALRDCGYCSLTSTIQLQLKLLLSGLWTQPWVSETLPVMDSLLDFLSPELDRLQNLKPTCRQTVLTRLHQEVALHVVKKLLKSRRQSQEEQGSGASRMKADAHKLHTFFTAQGGACERTTRILLQVSEVLRLQDPDLIQLELISLVQTCPDLSGVHVSRLLFLKSGQSAATICHIKRNVEETRPSLQRLTSQSPVFFSRIRVKWLDDKIATAVTELKWR